MNRLIGELLTLSRLEAGGPRGREVVDMRELMEALVEDARFEGERCAVAVEYCPGQMAEVEGSAELLHRAVENVVRNALRHSPKNGLVRIEAGVLAADAFHIRIIDQGSGVPEKDLEAIFHPFHRVETAGNKDGYGLGLAIALRIISATGGTIKASNPRGGGFAVDIKLPVMRFTNSYTA